MILSRTAQPSSFRLFILVGLLAVVVAECWAFARRQWAPMPRGPEARVSHCYVLSKTRWTEFSLLRGDKAIKLVTNAGVPRELSRNQRFFANYCLRYQLVGRGGKVIREREYTLRAGFLLRGDGSGRPVPVQYYLGLATIPLCPRSTVVDLDGLPEEPSRLRVSLSWAEPSVQDVTVRVYRTEAPQQRKLRYLWQRMSNERKRRLARANIYGLDLLTDAEKENLLVNRWVAVGPLGVLDRDYSERKVYTIDDRQEDGGAGSIVPRGLLVHEGTIGTIPLPEGGGCIRLEFELLREAGITSEESAAQITWFAPGVSERNDYLVYLTERLNTFQDDFPGGILEIHAPEAVVVRAFVEGGSGFEEITPDPEIVAAYRLRGDVPLEFVQSAFGGGSMPLRVDLRWLSDDVAASALRSVTYEVVGRTGRVSSTGTLEIGTPWSPYDCPVGLLAGSVVSEPCRYYFLLDQSCSAIRFRSTDDGVFLTAYTRPTALERRVLVPESYGAQQRTDEHSDWFLVRPIGYAECLRDQVEAVLRVQRRPGIVSSVVAAGEYHCIQHEPWNGPGGFRVMAKREPRLPDAADAPEARFAAVRAGETIRLLFAGRPGLPALRPRAVFCKSSSGFTRLRLSIDGTPLWEETVGGTSGEFLLPPISAGWRQVALEAEEPLDLYISRASEEGDPGYIERTVHGLGPTGLSFRIPRTGAESLTLSMRLYVPADLRARVLARVVVKDCEQEVGVPFLGWTFPSTVYDIREPWNPWQPLVGADGVFVAGGDAFFLTLGPDLPPGPCEILVTLDFGGTAAALRHGSGTQSEPRDGNRRETAYLQVSQVVAGRRDVRRVFAETGAMAAGEIHE